MNLGYPKTLGIILFAVLFSVVQTFCTCAPAAALPADANTMTPMHMQHDAGHDQASEEHTAPLGHGDHNDEAGCAHCDGDTAISSAADSATPTPLTPSAETAGLVGPMPTPPTRAHLAPGALAGLRWLHPPDATPVTLKVLFLN